MPEAGDRLPFPARGVSLHLHPPNFGFFSPVAPAVPGAPSLRGAPSEAPQAGDAEPNTPELRAEGVSSKRFMPKAKNDAPVLRVELAELAEPPTRMASGCLAPRPRLASSQNLGELLSGPRIGGLYPPRD